MINNVVLVSNKEVAVVATEKGNQSYRINDFMIDTFIIAEKVLSKMMSEGHIGTLFATTNVAKKASFLAKKEAKGERFFVKDYVSEESTPEYKKAVSSFLSTYRKALKQGITIKNVFLVDKAILDVPEGVELKAGDKVSFYNGKSFNGITVPSWKGFTRNNVDVKEINFGDKKLFCFEIGSKKNEVVKALIYQAWGEIFASKAA
jgi:hypothetical protein